MMSPKIGQNISHYRILKKLGAGGMGVVYKAEDTRLKRPVALKFLSHELTQGEAARDRFIREAQTASALDHPNICSIHEIDETQDRQLFICMAHYDGETLRERLRRGAVPLGEALDIVCQTAAGLEKAHNNGIFHRDVSPANVMVTKEDGVKIIDFGLAKLKERSRLTSTGSTLGTIVYMSPEQARGEEVDARSDIFSLGVVLYELLANCLPFDGEHETAVLYKILNVRPERLSKHKADIPEGLQRIVDKALQKDASSRYQSVAEMREDLLRVSEGLKPIRAALPRRYLRVVVPLAILSIVAVLAWTLPQLRNSLRGLLGAEPGGTHLAVLPFDNVGGDPANQVFCHGLMETVTAQVTQLAQYHGSLYVVPSIEVHREGVTSFSEAREILGINMVVTGSIQTWGDMFRVTLNLIGPVKNGPPRQLDAAVFDTPKDNIVSLQHEATLRLAQMLKVNLLPQEQTLLAAGGTAVSAAYYLYVQGNGYLEQSQKKENIDRAIVLFESAIAEDSLYAQAYYGLGRAHYWYGGSYKKAAAAFQKVIELTPDNIMGYNNLGASYYMLGRHEEARELFERSIEIAPSYLAYSNLGAVLHMSKRYAEAAEMCEKALDINDADYRAWLNLGNAYYWLPEKKEKSYEAYRRAVKLAEEKRKKKPADARLLASLAGYYAVIGEEHVAMARIEEALRLEPDDSTINYYVGHAFNQLGRREKAIEFIGKAVAGGYSKEEINSDPWLSELRMDERFSILMEGNGDTSEE
jgi:tetratricopeptide (TPR) repeat protein/predicted Ser/Thr protein kinase